MTMHESGNEPDASPERSREEPRHHLMIAGTGRAGTSFLVRFLAGMGLETHLAKSGDGQWDDVANAGFEDIPVPAASGDLPYVIKTPLLSEIIDDVLRNPAIAMDAVIIPVRDLVEVAASRTVLELQAIHQREPWMATLNHMVEHWGMTPGGTMYSLNPLDQGRLLAVGFHRLIERLTKADVPMLFLDFPRLAEDPAYLFAKLRPVLPAGATLEQAMQAHAQIADAAKIRVGRELQGAQSDIGMTHAGPVYPDPGTLEAIAVRRELARLRAETPGHEDMSHGRERQLGQRELAMGQRETAMQQRELDLANRADELARQADELAGRGGELDRREEELARQADALAGRGDELDRREEELAIRLQPPEPEAGDGDSRSHWLPRLIRRLTG